MRKQNENCTSYKLAPAGELESTKFLEQKLTYIHENPVRAGIVQNAKEYLYSSARNYANMDANLQITLIE